MSQEQDRAQEVSQEQDRVQEVSQERVLEVSQERVLEVSQERVTVPRHRVTVPRHRVTVPRQGGGCTQGREEGVYPGQGSPPYTPPGYTPAPHCPAVPGLLHTEDSGAGRRRPGLKEAPGPG